MATPVDLVLFENLLKAKSKDWAGERGNRRNNYELTSHSGNFGVGRWRGGGKQGRREAGEAWSGKAGLQANPRQGHL